MLVDASVIIFSYNIAINKGSFFINILAILFFIPTGSIPWDNFWESTKFLNIIPISILKDII
jgi:hypothetical protein